MTSTSTAKLESKLRWWHTPLIPFAFAGALVGLLVVLIMVAVVSPFAMITGWRLNRRIKRRLSADQRLISWGDAISERGTDGKELIVEFGPNKFGTVWLAEVPTSGQEILHSYPTYAMWEADPRATYETCGKIDQALVQQLVPYMRVAKRIDKLPTKLSEMENRRKDSLRILPIWHEESPTRLLFQLMGEKINA